jgi:hypothetical protein
MGVLNEKRCKYYIKTYYLYNLMYAVVEYDDYRKEQSFEVMMPTDDVDYAKKVAFQFAMNQIKNVSRYANDYIYRITTRVENEYLTPINKTIVSYKVIEVEKI